MTVNAVLGAEEAHFYLATATSNFLSKKNGKCYCSSLPHPQVGDVWEYTRTF